MFAFGRTLAFAGFISLFALACGDDGATGSGGATSDTGGDGGLGGGGAAMTVGGSGGGGGTQGGSGGQGEPFTSIGASSFETQTSLAASASGVIVVTWIALFANNTSQIGYSVSRDSGLTFSSPRTIASPDGRLASNPVVVVDSQGRFTLAWLGFRIVGNYDEHIYVARLDDATGTFGNPVLASDDGSSTTRDFDKPQLTVDADDALLLTFADFTTFNQAELTFARSADGQAWTRSTVTSDATFGNLAHVCLDSSLGPTAPLYMVHLGASGTITTRRSNDRGATWQLGVSPPAMNVVFQDVTCAVAGSTLHVVYATGDAVFDPTHDSPGDAIEIVSSTDGGTSFGAPTAITLAGPDQYLFPRVAIAPTGKLEVVYYQGQVAAPANFMHATSANGTTWTRAPIGPAGTFSIDRALASWLGAYVGVAIPGATGFVSYTENAAGKTHIAFAEVAIP